MRALFAIAVSLLLAACGSREASVNHMTTQNGTDVVVADLGPSPGAGTMTLPSGKQIKVLGIHKLAFSKGPPAYMISFQTVVAFDDKAALQHEADELWAVVRPTVEKAGLTAAVLSANEKPTGGNHLKHNRGFNFVFEEGPDGHWSQLEYEPAMRGPE
jgi:hypothetical protein